MPVLRPRTRVVYFRVTAEEFERYTRLCEAEGAHSLSDLIRSAVERLLPPNGEAGPPLESRFTAIEQKLESVQAKLNTLAALMLYKRARRSKA